MSVLIKDMKMPKSCYECKLDIRTDVCLAFSEWNKEHPYSIRATDRLPDCPLSEVPEPQWIPCSERLPDKTDDYLCSYDGCAVVDICEYDTKRKEWGFFYDGGWKVVSNVIAWMPLPEPYRGEEK